MYVAWDNSNTHEDEEVEVVVRGAAGRLVLLYLPTWSPWLNPIEMLWRHFRREVRHCELPLPSRHSSWRPTPYSTVTTGVRGGSCRSSVLILQKLRECT